jgi:hypothetical protein
VLRAVLLAALGSLALAASTTAAPTASRTESCKQVWGYFTVSLLGDRDWAWWSETPEIRRVPDARTVVMVHSLGGKGGANVYAWSTATRSAFSPKCTPVKRSLKAPNLSSLAAPITIKDGWHLGRGYACVERGPILTTITNLKNGARVVVRMQRSGKTIAVAEIAGAGGWIRGSKDCDERER